MLIPEVLGYHTRDGVPQKHTIYKDAEGNTIIEVNPTSPGDVVLADEAAYNAVIQAALDAEQAARAAEIASSDAYMAALNALKESARINLTSNAPLTDDEAYVLLYGKVPPPPE